MVSLKDIAKQAGVSVCAVSLVLNGKYKNRVSDTTAEHIRETAASLHYEPNMLARTLRTNKSHTLGFVTDEIITRLSQCASCSERRKPPANWATSSSP